MEVRVRERLVGALVLVAIVVLLVPAVLRGPDRAREAPPRPHSSSVEVLVEDQDRPQQDEILVPEPPAPQMAATADQPPAPESTQAAVVASDTAPKVASAGTSSQTQAPPGAGATAQTPAWAVQLGAFSTREKADGLVANLRKRGYAAFVLEYRASGRVLHRVRVGPEQDRERALAIAERLRKDGFQPVVAPHP